MKSYNNSSNNNMNSNNNTYYNDFDDTISNNDDNISNNTTMTNTTYYNEFDDTIPKDSLYQLHILINQSIYFAEEYLIKNHSMGFVNNIIDIGDGKYIDMYDYCVVNNRLNNGEYALVAYYGYNDLWYVRKTFDGLFQFFNIMINLDDDYYFQLFIKNYKKVTIYL